MTRGRTRVLTSIAVCSVVACGGERAAESQAAAQQAPGGGSASATLELGTETYVFPTVRCDLEDTLGTGMLVRGTTTDANGRRMTLEVERLQRTTSVYERVTIYLGGIVEGDEWTVAVHQWPDGRWMPEQGEPQDGGRLLVVDADQVTARGTFKLDNGEATRAGTLQAQCGG